MAEFAYNNTVSATTGITPFFALYGQHPRWIIKQNPATKTPTPAILEEWANQLENLNTYLKSEMVYAQATQAEQADKDRLPAPAYIIGDEVWLLCWHIQTTRPSSKLDFKRLADLKLLRKYPAMLICWTSLPPWNATQFFTYPYLNPQQATPWLDKSNLPHLLSSLTTTSNLRLKRYLIPRLSEKLWNTLSVGLVTTNSLGNLRNSWKIPLSWFTTSIESTQLNQNPTTCLSYDPTSDFRIRNSRQPCYPLWLGGWTWGFAGAYP